MRKWKRVETADGPRFRSALAPHEAALLHNMVTSMLGMLDDREAAAPSDPLNRSPGSGPATPQPPEDSTMRRLLPDFFRPADSEHPAGSAAADSLNGALRSLHEPDIIDAKRQLRNDFWTHCRMDGGRFELTEADANAWVAAVNDVRLALGTMLEIGPEGPDRLPADHPLAGHLDVYQWLTVLQEYLVLGLMGKPIR